MDIKMKVESFKSMMKSCYTYGGVQRDGRNFERYLTPYQSRLGNDLFNKIYEEYSEHLSNTYEVEFNVYSDFEGLTYHQLKLKL
jgi:hypothetical protein